MDEEPIQGIKEKLLKLSAKGLISKTSFQIKKMNKQNARIELEKYEQKLVSETADKIEGIIFDGVSKGLSYLDLIDQEDTRKLEEEIKTNNNLEEEVINISKSIAPWIPYIGLTLAGISVGKYAYTRYLRHRQNAEDTPNKENDTQSERVKDPGTRDPERASSTGVVSNSDGTLPDDN